MNKIETGGRRSGRTTKTMQAAPHGSVYVWVNDALDYPKDLARKLGREDLKIVGPNWLVNRQWAGLELTGLSLDHAAFESMTEEQWRLYRELTFRLPQRRGCSDGK